ncbi:PDDEXK nuclease domain-containing protein [Desulfonatronum thioautotrophicum]|uniref:PDDEXK nuclease domain-containing protein n=1 Tax=Desulfonatronum thioautotrophicum TaxID=617001 RepID=UPI0005EBB9C2|nr:PDDEXK nuclease domain-containing protein [Desulfonatronum thioautotrophicum]
MNRPMNFEHLVTLFQKTHEEVQNRALRAINLSLVTRNWLFGQYIVEFEQHGADRAAYGANLVDALSTRLKQLGIKGVSATRLRLYRTFYREYQQIAQTSPDSLVKSSPANPIQPTLSGELIVAESMQALSPRFTLGWSHYIELLTLDDTAERRFYEIEAAANQWSVRELQRQIASSLYQRLALSRDKDEIRRLAFDGQIVEKAADLIKNPLVLEFLGLEDRPHYSEEELESAIIDQLEIFLLELGKGFLFEARQKRFTFDNDHFRVDLVFYNRLLRCYVLIDLKRNKLTHQDLGQMQMYVNYFDRYVKLSDELPTVGIVLCHRKNDALVELTLPKEANIFASKYQLYLPSKEELKAQLQEITNELKQGAGRGGNGELKMEGEK